MMSTSFWDVLTFFMFVVIVPGAISVAVGDPQTRQKIVGGIDADDAEYPFLVVVGTDGFSCSGSIISRRYVLTAAHCVHELTASDLPEFRVRTGNLRSRKLGGRVYGVESIRFHADFQDYGNYPHDIAIIKVNQTIKFDRFTQPISLSESVPRVSNKVTVVGWGRTDPDISTPPFKPQQVDERVISRKSCAKAHRPDPIDRNHICVMGSRRFGICNGDSGGPALFNNALVGITSFSGPSCARGVPDVFTSIPYHLEWIDKTITEMADL